MVLDMLIETAKKKHTLAHTHAQRVGGCLKTY